MPAEVLFGLSALAIVLVNLAVINILYHMGK